MAKRSGPERVSWAAEAMLPASRWWNSSLCPRQGAPLPLWFVALIAAPLARVRAAPRNRAIGIGISLNICRDTREAAEHRDRNLPILPFLGFLSREIVDRAVLSLKDAGVPSFLME
jgi:hypothetical protein